MSRLAKSIFCISVLFLGLFLFDGRPLIANDKDNRQMIISKSIHEGMAVTDFYFDYQKKTATLSINLYNQKQKLQEIKIGEVEKPYSYGWHITDVNFDGYQDILVLYHVGGVHAYNEYKLWLWNNEKGQYEEYQGELPINLAIDRKNQLLLSRKTNWAASHTYAIYQFQDGKIVLTHELLEEALLGGPVQKIGVEEFRPWKFIESQNIGGQMIEIEQIYLTTSDDKTTRKKIAEKYFLDSSIWRLGDIRWMKSDHGSRMGITDKDGKEVKVGLEE